MDRVGADFAHSVETIVSRLKCKPVPIQLPVGSEDQFKGVVDLVTMKGVLWHDETLGAQFDVVDIPADLVEAAKEAREKMIEAVAEHDDHLFEKFIEGQPVTEDEIRAGKVKWEIPDTRSAAEQAGETLDKAMGQGQE
jgi:elongation factor G